jgi:hypothetical protein
MILLEVLVQLYLPATALLLKEAGFLGDLPLRLVPIREYYRSAPNAELTAHHEYRLPAIAEWLLAIVLLVEQ